MNKTKEYVVNTAILFVGKFVTQFMTFLLLPLYTRYLVTGDYGIVDITQTYISLFVPILTLRLDTAAFRFLIDCRKDEKKKQNMISHIIFVLFIQIILFFILFGIVRIFFKFNYANLILFNIPAIMLSNVLLQLARGVGKNKDYSIACIITGISTLIINVVLIVFLKQNGGSILVASAIANILCTIYLLFKIKIHKYISFKEINKKEIKNILSYVLPMVPNSLSWWILNVSDRTIIATVINASANGIYSISSKFSNILNQVFSIFNMSWQETASIHLKDKDRDVFFSDMINKILIFFFQVSLLLLAVLPLAFDIIIGKDYLEAYKFIPILLFANIFNVFTNLLGGIYIAYKETKKMATTTIIAATINIVLNVLFIKKIGLYAACLSTLIAYLFVAIYRYFDIKKYIKYKADFKNFLLNLIVFLFLLLTYYVNNMYVSIIMLLFISLFFFYTNKTILKQVKNKILKKKKTSAI